MLIAFVILMVCMMIVFAAGRIILGWVIPAPTMARIDDAFNRAGNLFLKLIVVLLGAMIVYLIVVAARAP